MTRRELIAFTIAAAVLAVVAVAVSPLLHHDHTSPPTPVRNAERLPSPPIEQITTLATAAATRALACRPIGVTSLSAIRGERRGWCGWFTVTRLQTACRTQTRCEVEAIGTFTAPDTSGLVAVTVDVQLTDGGEWRVLAVRS